MATLTTHYSLAKPAIGETGYHTVFNTGMDNIDAAIWSNSLFKSGFTVSKPSTSIQTVYVTSFVDVNGMSVSYSPPAGSSNVVIVFEMHMSGDVNGSRGEIQFVKNGSVYPNSRCDVAFYDWQGYKQTFLYIVPAWTGAQTLKLQTRAYTSTASIFIHSTATYNGSISQHYVAPYVLVFSI